MDNGKGRGRGNEGGGSLTRTKKKTRSQRDRTMSHLSINYAVCSIRIIIQVEGHPENPASAPV